MTHGLYIGVMSGTSMNGIDAALVRFDDDRTEFLHGIRHEWPSDLVRELRQIAGNTPTTAAEIGHLDALAGEHFAAAVLRLLGAAGVLPDKVRAVGCHGQTVYHAPTDPIPFTIQIGDPNRIAHRTGITTVADFRRRDMAGGGQGAPLVPAFHQSLFGHLGHVAVLNIGGIANLTLLTGSPLEPVRGFDTGPGNCLMDTWVRAQRQRDYDSDGAWAQTGTISAALLQQFLADPYFMKAPPKSTGIEYFSMPWLTKTLQEFPEIAATDVQATLLQLTAQTIADALRRSAPSIERVLVCGGGIHNRTLMNRLATMLAPVPVESTAQHGLAPDWVEAVAFAWLARQTLDHQPGNLPAVTGAGGTYILGGIYQA